ncbi:hypothetical protein ACIPRD_26530 [Streptomyces sp. NPDC090108]|uniref:hypothetical protein n=1 Tax=Streptomyces sp. NPDC090108 TaxID=3365947 RepID=UPI0037F42E97
MTRGFFLYARSRAVPAALVGLAATAVLALWAAHGPDTFTAPDGRVPLVVLAPLMAAAAIGVSLRTASAELERTAVRAWGPRRLVQLVGLTAPAVALLSAAAPGHPGGFGTPEMIRNTLGCAGITAAAAVLLGSRLSWLPAFLYVAFVCPASQGTQGRAALLWAWPMQPGARPEAWAAAVAVFVVGAVLYAVRGARPEGPRA